MQLYDLSHLNLTPLLMDDNEGGFFFQGWKKHLTVMTCKELYMFTVLFVVKYYRQTY